MITEKFFSWGFNALPSLTDLDINLKLIYVGIKNIIC